jgi:hypothetical protein
MTPEEVVLQLKKKGTFDELRKQALQEFQAKVSLPTAGQPFNQFILANQNSFLRNPAKHLSMTFKKSCKI